MLLRGLSLLLSLILCAHQGLRQISHFCFFFIHRKFKGVDISTTVMKSAPDFCSVYIISKGKILSVRTAQRPAANTAAPPRQPSPGIPPQIPSDHGELDDPFR